MKTEYTVKAGNKSLVLIFSGWSTTPSFYSHIRPKGYDVAVVWDYSDVSFSFDHSQYDSVFVFAWSLGVVMADRVLDARRVALAVALNGTLRPVDDVYGIPEGIYCGTYEALELRTLAKFRRRMTGDAFNEIGSRFEDNDIERLKAGLACVEMLPKREGSGLHWNRAYVSTRDYIFPPENQLNFWSTQSPDTDIVTLDTPHYVDLGPVVEGCLPNAARIGEKFRKALPTYCEHARVQNLMALRLAGMCRGGKIGRMVEIGPGSGVLTRLLGDCMEVGHVDFIDLYELPRFNIAREEAYHVCNAEEWIDCEARENPGSCNLIVSGSTVQWFSNPRLFFENASRLLAPGGEILFSTFLPGTMKELKGLNPYGLVYRTREELEGWLKPYFTDLIFEETTVEQEFATGRETALHLKATGVGGASKFCGTTTALLSSLPRKLTFNALFVRGVVSC